jgi:hypothetical protein
MPHHTTAPLNRARLAHLRLEEKIRGGETSLVSLFEIKYLKRVLNSILLGWPPITWKVLDLGVQDKPQDILYSPLTITPGEKFK